MLKSLDYKLTPIFKKSRGKTGYYDKSSVNQNASLFTAIRKVNIEIYQFIQAARIFSNFKYISKIALQLFCCQSKCNFLKISLTSLKELKFKIINGLFN